MKPPKLPELLARKIYKTGQTRGSDDDEIFQNRVGRNSTVLIPLSQFEFYLEQLKGGFTFEKGYIVLISPDDYFDNSDIKKTLLSYGLELGRNALVFYETRSQWIAHNPESLGWTPATSRVEPLGGQFVARVSATTALENGARILQGFTTTTGKGAGIRVYEYASIETIQRCRLQLEALFWLCPDAQTVVLANGLSKADVKKREQAILEECKEAGLLDTDKLISARVLNSVQHTTCPLCLEELSATGFFSRMEQALGREVHDLTITQVNLFHIREVQFGAFNHTPYNLGWGHHHCNVVVKDSGIEATLEWMQEVLERNRNQED